MSRFNRSEKYSLGSQAPKEEKHGTVRNIKGSPEKGKKRLMVREKSSGGRSFAVDIDINAARKIERKETYTFQVEEKHSDDRYGSMGRKKSSGFKTYYCDEAPEKYGGGGGANFKSFDSSNRMKKARTKFS
jgi:hypothetical protein